MSDVQSVLLHEPWTVDYKDSFGTEWSQSGRTVSDEYYHSRNGSRTNLPATGWRPPTAYYATYGKFRKAKGTYEYKSPSGTMVTLRGTDPWNSYNSPYYPFPGGLKQQAEVDALTKLKDQGVNLAQAFAERDQLANLVGDTATRLARAYRAVRRGQFKKAAQALGASWRKSTSNWLELQYAWKPLLGDVYGSVKELQGRPPRSWLVTVKGVKREEIRDEVTWNPEYMPLRRFDRGYHGAFVRLDYHPTDGFMDTVSRLGLTNPMALAWELLPFSFVVDWLWPVGDWLSVLDATSGFKFASGSCSTITRVTSRFEVLSYSGTVRNQMGDGWSRSVYLNRTLYPSSPLPRPPGLKNPLSLGHMANGLSLLAEAFKRR